MESPAHGGPVEVDGEEIVEVRWSQTRLDANRGSLIERILIDDGLWEQTVQIRFHFALSPGDTFVDCGANVGAHACVLAAQVGKKGHVVAIEPVPELADRLARNRALNGLRNVTIVRKAAAATTGRRSFYAPEAAEDKQGQAASSRTRGPAGVRSRLNQWTASSIA